MATFNPWLKGEEAKNTMQTALYYRVKSQNSSEQQEDMLTNANSSESETIQAAMQHAYLTLI